VRPNSSRFQNDFHPRSRIPGAIPELFFGYGSLAAPVWFIGMEEGGCRELGEFRERLHVWQSRGSAVLEDGPAYHHAIKRGDLFAPNAKTQKTWGKLIRLYLGYAGQPCDRESIRRFQIEKFGSKDCGFASLELLPLPSQRIDKWIYGTLAGPDFLQSRKAYTEHMMPRRIQRLRELIEAHQPRCIVCYGRSYLYAWQELAGAPFEATALAGVSTARFANTLMISVPHPVARTAGGDIAYWNAIGASMRSDAPL